MSLWNKFGLTLLIAAFALSLGRQAFSEKVLSKDLKIITVGHWQLESGWREGYDVLFRKYEKLHPDVKIEQAAMPGRYYNPWISTQLLGGTPPELAEVGREPEEFLPRYYTDLEPYIKKPNPYNKGTELEHVPWMQTMQGEMAGGFRPQYMAYFAVPMSSTVFRVYYNKDMFREVLGHDRPPKDFDEWIAFSEKIKAWGLKQPQHIVPMAAIGEWTSNVMSSIYNSCTSFTHHDILDFNHNGKTGTGFGIKPKVGEQVESFMAIYSGKLSFDNPEFRASLGIIETLRPYFQPGFIATSWDDGKFLFVQGKAAMMTTGSWETKSFIHRAKFEVGGFPLPVPDRNHPKFGKHIYAPVSEVGLAGGASYGVPKYSKHPEIAIDLLQFLTSKKNNEFLMNEFTYWPPLVKGAKALPKLQPFAAKGEGIRGGLSPYVGPDTQTEHHRLLTQWLNKELTKDQFIEQYEKAYKDKAPGDVKRSILLPKKRSISGIERKLNALQFYRAVGLMEKNPTKETQVFEAQLDLTFEWALLNKKFNDMVKKKPEAK